MRDIVELHNQLNGVMKVFWQCPNCISDEPLQGLIAKIRARDEDRMRSALALGTMRLAPVDWMLSDCEIVRDLGFTMRRLHEYLINFYIPAVMLALYALVQERQVELPVDVHGIVGRRSGESRVAVSLQFVPLRGLPQDVRRLIFLFAGDPRQCFMFAKVAPRVIELSMVICQKADGGNRGLRLMISCVLLALVVVFIVLLWIPFGHQLQKVFGGDW